MKLPCLYCSDTLTFDQAKGWQHSNGFAYVGECRCNRTAPHPNSHVGGDLICPTWRDHHIATPDRSKRTTGGVR